MTTVMKNQTNNCTNGIANLCCPSNNQTNGEQQPNGIPKKIVKVIDLPNHTNREMNGKGPLKSPPPPHNNVTTTADLLGKMKIIEDESSLKHGIKLTDVGLPHISLQTIECKKTEKPQTTIIIYKPKNGGAPTAKVIMTKVFFYAITNRYFFFFAFMFGD